MRDGVIARMEIGASRIVISPTEITPRQTGGLWPGGAYDSDNPPILRPPGHWEPGAIIRLESPSRARAGLSPSPIIAPGGDSQSPTLRPDQTASSARTIHEVSKFYLPEEICFQLHNFTG